MEYKTRRHWLMWTMATALAVGLAVPMVAVAGSPRYSVTNLDAITGFVRDYWQGDDVYINDIGQALGPWGVWTPGVASPQPLVFGSRPFGGVAINNQGQVAGFQQDDPIPPEPEWYSALLYTPGVGTVRLGPGRPTGLNDLGQVVGIAEATRSNFAPWFWTPVAGEQPIGPAGATEQGYGGNVNNAGLIVANGKLFATVSSPGQPTGFDVGLVNNTGQVINLGGEHIYTPGEPLLSTGELPGNRPTHIEGQNDLAQVVGGATFDIDEDRGRAFLWSRADGLEDLNFLLDDSGAGWVLQDATDINNLGQIVGWGQSPDGREGVAFLLTPVPEPGIAGLGVIFCGLLARRRAVRN